MWYYLGGIILLSHISDLLNVGEKVYKVCNGVYTVTSYIMPSKQIKNENDDQFEWIELKLFKDNGCQTEDFDDNDDDDDDD